VGKSIGQPTVTQTPYHHLPTLETHFGEAMNPQPGIAEVGLVDRFARPIGSTHLMNLVNVASFLLRRCPIVVRTVVRTAEISDIAIRFYDRRARDQKKLFAHFREPCAAVFAVQEIEDGRHDRPPSFARRHTIISLEVHYVI
jgi:hypothetical protein